ncbi:hypothetical protein ACTGJ9_024655 [Bradyrhizobium sp. RDM12]
MKIVRTAPPPSPPSRPIMKFAAPPPAPKPPSAVPPIKMGAAQGDGEIDPRQQRY